MDVVWKVILQVFESYRVQILTLVGLILLDVVMGVASAIKAKAFKWNKLADFYCTTVLPQLIGWIGLTVTMHLVVPDVYGVASSATANLAWATIVANLGASVGKSFKEVFGADAPKASAGTS